MDCLMIKAIVGSLMLNVSTFYGKNSLLFPDFEDIRGQPVSCVSFEAANKCPMPRPQLQVSYFSLFLAFDCR